MITEKFLDLFFNAFSGLLTLLPDFHFEIDASFFTNFFECIRLVGYLLPMGTVVVIILLIMSLTFFKIAVAVVKFIYSFIAKK